MPKADRDSIQAWKRSAAAHSQFPPPPPRFTRPRAASREVEGFIPVFGILRCPLPGTATLEIS